MHPLMLELHSDLEANALTLVEDLHRELTVLRRLKISWIKSLKSLRLAHL